MARERIQALVDETGLQGIIGETGDTQDIENIDDTRYSRTLMTSCYLCNLTRVLRNSDRERVLNEDLRFQT